MIVLKPYQQTAADQAVDILMGGRATPSDGERNVGPTDRRGVLIEAPTGSGKTVMAGTVVAGCSETNKILWFWFAPFAGVTGQAAAALETHFPQLRIRDVYNDRAVEDLRPSDVYVTTWGAVAARTAASRVVRSRSEEMASLDQLVDVARAAGWLIGVVVDEAHHGFVKAPVAKSFFRDVLAPDLTILVTATPNDGDIETFRVEAGLPPIAKVSVSRTDAVAAGLIKPGVRAVSFVPAPNTGAVQIDYERTALRYAVDTHTSLKRALAKDGHSIVPLMLVQVASDADSVQRAKQTLADFGIPEATIAVHTADEPDPNILALANDENYQVLIFKMAVALGFDAPRAWTLVSMRSSRDVDFGIQLVGRVLRVDRRLQGRPLPDALRFGYVFVADPDVQQGLVTAAAQINRLTTDVRRVAVQATMVLVQVGPTGTKPLNVTEPSEADRERAREEGIVPQPFSRPSIDTSWQSVIVPSDANVDLFGIAVPDAPERTTANANENGTSQRTIPLVVTERFEYALRTDLSFPRRLRTERFPIDDMSLARCVGDRIRFDAEALQALQREGVYVVRRDRDLFNTGAEAETITQVQGDLDMRAILRRGQSVLFEDDYVGGNSLLPALVQRFTEQCQQLGLLAWLKDEETLEQGVYRILGTNPLILRRAIRECMANYVEAPEADPLPDKLVSDVPLRSSRLNVYGVYPSDLNTWEVEFAEMLDLDTTGQILWWHRNPPRKPWSARVCAPGTNHDYYPDFAIGVRGRATPDEVLLAETKFAYNTKDSMAKARAEHKVYKNVLMLTRDEKSTWWTLQYDLVREKVVEDRRLLLSMLAGF